MRKLASEVSFIGAGQAVAVLMTLGLQVFVVRTTEPALYGAYVAALAVATMIQSIFVGRSGELALQTVGKNWVLGRFVAAREDAKRMHRLDWVLNAWLYVLTVLLALGLSWLFDFNPGYIAALALMIPLQNGYGVYKSLFISTSKLNQQAAFEAASSTMMAVLGAAGVYWFGIYGLIFGQVVATLLRTVAARLITYRWWPTQAETGAVTREDQGAWASWRSMGLHSVMRNAFVNGSTQADVLILSAAQSPASVAIYKVAKSLSSLPSRVFSPLWFALRPRMLRAVHEEDSVRLLRLVALPGAVMIGLFILLLFPIMTFADDVIGAVYGAAYRSAALPFLWLLAGAWAFNAATAWFNVWVIISEEMVVGTSIYGVLFAALVVSGLTFGRESALHMAIAVSASMVIASIVVWVVFIRVYKGRGRGAVPEPVTADA